MPISLVIFFNQALFTMSAVLAGYYLKSDMPIGTIVCQTWIIGYLIVRICAVTMQLKTLQTTSILKSIAMLSIFNIILTVGCACAFLDEAISSVDVISILLTFVALLLL